MSVCTQDRSHRFSPSSWWNYCGACMWSAIVSPCAVAKDWSRDLLPQPSACAFYWARCGGLKSWIDYPAALHTRLITVCANDCDFSGFRGDECHTSRYNYITNEEEPPAFYRNVDEFA